jgi:hypothetical protein
LELSAPLFEEITGRDPFTLDTALDDDRRRAPRVPLLSRAAVYPAESGVGQSSVVYVNDVSLFGVGFFNRDRMTLRQEFILQLPRKHGPSVMILAGVERCEPCGSRFFIGASFVRILSEDQATRESRLPAPAQPVVGQR